MIQALIIIASAIVLIASTLCPLVLGYARRHDLYRGPP